MSIIMNTLMKAFEKEDTINNLISKMSEREKMIYKLSLSLIINKLNDGNYMEDVDEQRVTERIKYFQNMTDEEFLKRVGGKKNGKSSY